MSPFHLTTTFDLFHAIVLDVDDDDDWPWTTMSTTTWVYQVETASTTSHRRLQTLLQVKHHTTRFIVSHSPRGFKICLPGDSC